MFAVNFFTRIESADAKGTGTVDKSTGQTDFD